MLQMKSPARCSAIKCIECSTCPLVNETANIAVTHNLGCYGYHKCTAPYR